MSLVIVKDHWYHGNDTEALKHLKNLKEDEKIEGKMIEILLKFQFGSSNQAIDEMLKLYKETRLDKNYDSFIIAVANGWLNTFLRNFTKSIELFREAEKILNELVDSDYTKALYWQGTMYILMGFSYNFTNEREHSLELLQKGKQIVEKTDNIWHQGIANYYLCYYYLLRKDLVSALKCAQLSLEIFESLDNRIWQSFSLTLMSIIHHHQNKLDLALVYSLQALMKAESKKNYWGIIFAIRWIWQHYKSKNEEKVALQFFISKIKEYENNGFFWGVIALCARIASIYKYLGKLKEALDYYELRSELEINYGHELDSVWTLSRIGDIFKEMGNFRQSINYYERGIVISEKYERIDLIGDLLVSTGKAYFSSADLDSALKILTKANHSYKQVGDLIGVGNVLNLIGDIYRTRGELKNSLSRYMESQQIYESIDSKILPSNVHNWAKSISNIGNLYQFNKLYDEAFKQYRKVLMHYKKSGDLISLSKIYFHLIVLMYDMNEPFQVNIYFEELKSLTKKTTHPFAILYFDISEAIVLKNSPRMYEKGKAIQILNNIVKGDNLIHDVTIFAMLNLCELLIAELTAFGEEIVLIEVKMISDKLYSIAEKQNSYYLLVETLIIKSKVALIEFDLEGSQKLLNEAMTFVNKFKLLHLSSKVEDQINKFRDTLNYWETYSNQNASLIERLKLSDLQEYMDKIFKMLPDVNASE